MRLSRKLKLIAFAALSVGAAQAQRPVDVMALNKKQALYEAKQSRIWHKGKIVLHDATVLNGLVKYDFLKNYATIAVADELVAFNEKDILYMDFWDETKNKLIKLCSFRYDGKTLLFEILAEFKQFNLLSHKEPVTYYGKNLDDSLPVNSSVTSGFQRQIVVILDESGKMIPYIEKKLHRAVLKEYFSDEAYKGMWQYASRNKLKFNDAEDFTEIVEANRKYFDQ
jgi:hypothetical protein